MRGPVWWKPLLRGDDRGGKALPTLLRHRIFALSAPRMASRDTLQSEPAPAERAMPFHGLEKIGRAGRMKPAAIGRSAEPREERRECQLVDANEETNEQSHRQGGRIEAGHARRKLHLLIVLRILDAPKRGLPEGHASACPGSGVRLPNQKSDVSRTSPARCASRRHSFSSAPKSAFAAAGRAITTSQTPSTSAD